MVQTEILNTEVFWGEMSPVEHSVQIYANDKVFIDMLESFVTGGFRAGESVIVIATPTHRGALEFRMRARGIDLAAARERDQYMSLDAKAVLAQFMVDGWPDEERIRAVVLDLLARAGKSGRRVRAFGEMVAILWSQGHNGATVRLENLWHELCEEQALCVFCAYPKTGFTQEVSASIREICSKHSRVVGE